MNRESNWRYNFVGAALLILPVLIILQVIRIRINPEVVDNLIAEGKSLSGEYKIVTPARGRIYDRWGHLLAGNKTAYEIGIDLYRVQNPDTIAQTLNLVLGSDYAKVLGAASLQPSRKAVYAVVADNVSQEKVDQLSILIQQMKATYGSNRDENAPSLSGLEFKPHLQRTYPEKMLASNMMGFVSSDGVGFFGVEAKYNDLLAGKKEVVWVPMDPYRVQELPDISEGASLILTIDRAVQQSMENILDSALRDSGSESGAIVVINPTSGEVMAMATTPRLDLNEFWTYENIYTNETPYNKAVSQAYEPGSVYKVLTMASALDSGAVTPETTFIDTGAFEIGGIYIYNWNMGAWGPQDMLGCMQHSLNVCLAWVSSQVGAKDFYGYMQAFGIGQLTGIDLAGEATGRLKVPGDDDWYDADLGTNAFGQGVAATPLQMATAASAIANHGVMMAPHIVRSVVNDGYQHDIEKRVLGMPIKAETADILTKMLSRSLEKESSDALITGYRVAGKTGTAEIPTPFGYTTNATNASFVGWGPIDDPQFLVYIWLEKPKSSPWGSVVASPVFRDVVEQLVVLLDIPPDDIRKQLNAN
jgi:cell division protein FtsI/penicillin-binding protein 2